MPSATAAEGAAGSGAALLGAIGIAGVVADAVTQRTPATRWA